MRAAAWTRLQGLSVVLRCSFCDGVVIARPVFAKCRPLLPLPQGQGVAWVSGILGRASGPSVFSLQETHLVTPMKRQILGGGWGGWGRGRRSLEHLV